MHLSLLVMFHGAKRFSLASFIHLAEKLAYSAASSLFFLALAFAEQYTHICVAARGD